MKYFANLIPNISCCFILLFSTNILHAQCDANFTYTTNQNTVYFTGAAQGDASAILNWSFGDGQNGFGNNPSHTYTEPGTYNVTLTVTDSFNTCSQSSVQNVIVDFTFSCSVSFSYNYGVSFQDSVAGINIPQYSFYSNPQLIGSTVQNYSWTIDGTQVSTSPNFSYSFATSGKHSVCVQIQTADGCTSQSCQTISAFTQCNLHPSFTYSFPDPLNMKLLKFIVSPQLQGATYLWYFSANGMSYLSGDSVENQFGTGGSYNVYLQLIDSSLFCMVSDTQTVSVPYSVCDTAKVYFNYVTDSFNNQKIYFTMGSNEPVQSQSWSICSNQGFNCFPNIYANNFSYIFPDSGYSYTVCLDAVTSQGCPVQYCSGISVGDSLCGNATISFTADSMNNQYSFAAVSNQNISSQYWVISSLNPNSKADSVVLATSNPTYSFKDTGFYNICLFAGLNPGCNKSYCNIIDIKTDGAILPPYPNPATGAVKLNVPLTAAATISINVYNINGTNIYSAQIPGINGLNTISIPVQNLPEGQYFIKLNYNGQNKTSVFEKF